MSEVDEAVKEMEAKFEEIIEDATTKGYAGVALVWNHEMLAIAEVYRTQAEHKGVEDETICLYGTQYKTTCKELIEFFNKLFELQKSTEEEVIKLYNEVLASKM